MSQIPQDQKVYRLTKPGEGIQYLEQSSASVEKPKRGQVLVRIHAASLNYRDILVSDGRYPRPYAENLIPVSDGAGEVVQVGDDVTEYKVGDRVCGLFHQYWIDGEFKDEHMGGTLGGGIQGMLQHYRVFDTKGLIKFPAHLSYEEASTLPCAALTAWNALAENPTQHIGPDQTVLVLGTGGVSIFAIQFAAAAGARVIVTSSSDAKLAKAKELVATDFINYSKNPNWDEKVREITNGRGVDHVMEVGGAGTLERSLKAVKRGGQIHMIGVLAGSASVDYGAAILFGGLTLRGLLVGSKGMFERMNRTIQHHNIKPVVDRVFPFAEAKEALEYFSSQKHVGKVVIRID